MERGIDTIKIPIDQYSYDDIKMYEKDTVEFEPGVTYLVGCNGSGKTTLMKQIETNVNNCGDLYAIAKRFDCRNLDNLTEMFFYGAGSGDSIQYGCQMLSSSEGERISIGLKIAFDWMWEQCRSHKSNSIPGRLRTVVLMLDSLDSGIDIPTIRKIRNVLYEVVDIARNEFNTYLYVIVSANNYALIEGKSCLDIRTGETIEFDDWADYASFCEKSDEIKQENYSK